jgi:sporulation protein YabP
MSENFVKESLVKIENQNIMSITGVEKVISFSPTQIILVAMGSEVIIQGNSLETTKLDDKTRELFVNGLILSIKWQTKKEKLPFYKRLFK